MFIIPILVMLAIQIMLIIITFALVRKVLSSIKSDLSPFSFADDMLIISTRALFAIQISQIDCINLWYNPKSLQNRHYNMKINIVKTNGSSKNIRYMGRGSATTPEDIAASLKEHNVKCILG